MISAIVLTKNEDNNIKECLDSLSWCDELIVIDDNSSDKTVEIAKQKKARIFIHPLTNNFAQQRNFGLEKAKGDWVFFVDADERVSPALWYEIMQLTNDPISSVAGYYVKRRDVLWGKELLYGEVGKIKLLRLAKKGAGEWKGKVHETWQVQGKKDLLQNVLLHYPHQTMAEFLKEINFYTDLRAQELYEKKVSSSWWSIVAFPISKFVLNVIIKGGFVDGIPGIVFGITMSLHSFLVRGKLWLLWQRK